MSKKDIAGKYIFIVATGIAATLLAAPVYAQTKTASAPAAAPSAPAAAPAASPSPAPAATPPANDKAAEAKRFSADKEKILGRIDDFMEKMKKKRACVQASTDHDAMKTCLAPLPPPAASESKGDNGKGDANASSSAPATPPAVKK